MYKTSTNARGETAILLEKKIATFFVIQCLTNPCVSVYKKKRDVIVESQKGFSKYTIMFCISLRFLVQYLEKNYHKHRK